MSTFSCTITISCWADVTRSLKATVPKRGNRLKVTSAELLVVILASSSTSPIAQLQDGRLSFSFWSLAVTTACSEVLGKGDL